MSFAAHEMYLYRLDLVNSKAAPVAVVRTTYNNWLANSDLIDWDGGDQLLLSNLFSGSQSLYRVNLAAETLEHVADYNGLGNTTGERGIAKCHSAAFFPGRPDLVIATNSLAPRYETVVFNKATGHRLLQIKSDSKWYPQDTVFLGNDTRYMFVLYTTTKIGSQANGHSMWNYSKPVAGGKECLAMRMGGPTPCHLRVALYSIDVDRSTSREIAAARISGGHPDSMVYREGVLFVSDQLNDVIHVYTVDFTSSADAPSDIGFVTMSLLPKLSPITGFHMPHGIDVAHNMIAVASYGDNSVKIMPLPLPIRAVMARTQAALTKMRELVPDPDHRASLSYRELANCPPGRPCGVPGLRVYM
eukprot:m.19672 g.19672  ORF g.19672 m.19672 type:complete len:359 (-) comp10020_c1_seq1:12-1088(-)